MKIAVISRQGLGDGLLMMICAYHFKKANADVTFYHRLFHELSHFFPGYEFKDLSVEENFSSFDLILLEYYKSPHVDRIIANRKNLNLHVLYPTLKKKDRQILTENDLIFDGKKSLAENLVIALEKILHKSNLEKTNGMVFPKNIQYQKFKKRVILQPTSTDKFKNWRKKRFLKLYHMLEKKGLEPCLCLAPHEKIEWEQHNLKIFAAKDFHELASFIYESRCLIGNDSGPAHLASNLNIPSIVLASNARTMRLWKPDFFSNYLITASSFIPNFSFFRIRNKYWSYFISVSRVLKKFNCLITEKP